MSAAEHGAGVAAAPAAANCAAAYNTAAAAPPSAQLSATRHASRQSSADSGGSAHAERHSTRDSPEPEHAVRLPEDSSAQAAYEASRRHMTLTLEHDPAALTRWLVGTLQVIAGLGIVLLIVELSFKTAKRDDWFAKRYFPILNVVLASVCLVAMSAANVVCIRHMWRARRLQWSKRRTRLVVVHYAMLNLQMANAAAWLAPNIRVLQTRCAWFSSFMDNSAIVRWTCWNTLFFLLSVLSHCSCPMSFDRQWWAWIRRAVRKRTASLAGGEGDGAFGEQQNAQGRAIPGGSVAQRAVSPLDTISGVDAEIVLDAPFYYHWPSAIIWIVLEFNLIWQTALDSRQRIAETFEHDSLRQGCSTALVDICDAGKDLPQIHDITRLLGIFLFYAGLMLLYRIKSFRALQKSPYHAFKTGNMIARIQRQTSRLSVWFLFVSTVVLWFVRSEMCSNYLFTWLGLAPNQMVMAALVIVLAFFFMPRNASDLSPLRKLVLQEVAWDEASRERKRAERAAIVAKYQDIGDLQHQPLFCAETALKAFHWSFVSYQYEEHAGADVEAAESPGDPDALEGGVPFDPVLGAALQLLDLRNVSIMREAMHDTKLLLASGPSAIVLSFRGTSSAAAAWADLQVIPTRHPRQPAHAGPGWPALVHRGFLAAWTAGGFRKRVLATLRELLDSYGKGQAPRILITGHSLGGALSVLAAYDIQTEFALPFRQVEVYTYGCPRVGNASFSAAYDKLVPETWHVINDRDTITQVGKFRVYKRTGQQIIVNPLGDLIVRPAPIERRLHFSSQWLGLLGELMGSIFRGCRGSAKSRLTDHFLSEYGFSFLMTLGAQFTAKRQVGGGEGVIRMLRNDTLRYLLESGGFVLEEVLQDAGFELKDGELTVAADSNGALSSEDSLANVYKLGERKRRRNRKRRSRRDYMTAPFAAAKRRWQGSATADGDTAAQ